MKLRRIKAVFMKQIKDTAHNKGIIIQFLAFPIILLCLILSLPNGQAQNRTDIVMVMATTFTGMLPILTVFNVIRDDIYQHTLRVLILSTVKPMEYLIGITSYILIISLLNSCIFGLIGGLGGVKFILFVATLMIGIATTLVLGSALAIHSTSKAGAGGLIIVVSLLNGMIPLMGMFNHSIQKYSKYLYTTQINNMLSDIYRGTYNWERIAIVLCNLILFLILFVYSYRANRFYE